MKKSIPFTLTMSSIREPSDSESTNLFRVDQEHIFLLHSNRSERTPKRMKNSTKVLSFM